MTKRTHALPGSTTPLGKVKAAMSVLESPAGAEYFFTAESPPDWNLAEGWNALLAGYEQALGDAGLGRSTEVFVRLHLSDALNQIPWLRGEIERRAGGGLFSLVGQSSLGRNKIALEAYHAKGARPCSRRHHPGGHVVLDHGRYQSIWGSFRTRATGGSGPQTTDLLQQLEGVVASHGGTLADNCVRTWFYVRDIDTHYQGLVEARRVLFERCGMTRDTHYLASTGIAGELQRVDEIVAMDALMECGLAPGQIQFMTAEKNLCPTHHYGVTFERGTRVTYGDRSHFFISGTASIDDHGNILHEGDLEGQIDRTVENIEALMANQGARLADLKQAVVYLRDAGDGERARTRLATLLPATLPILVVEGRVCRPGWLVEIEGIGGTTVGDPRFSDYF